MDTFVRSYMDVAGFVPVALVCAYQNVACFACTYEDVLERLAQLKEGESPVEMDANNETVRLRNGWDVWLMPNATGERGLPLYVKQTQEQEQMQYMQMQMMQQQMMDQQQQQMQQQGEEGMGEGQALDMEETAEA